MQLLVEPNETSPGLQLPRVVHRFDGVVAPTQLGLLSADPDLRLTHRAQPGGVQPQFLKDVPHHGLVLPQQVAGSAEQPVADGLKAVADKPVLTVTDADHGEARGMIHFAMQQSRVKFHIDQGAATRGALTLSSKLLALALSVKS